MKKRKARPKKHIIAPIEDGIGFNGVSYIVVADGSVHKNLEAARSWRLAQKRSAIPESPEQGLSEFERYLQSMKKIKDKKEKKEIDNRRERTRQFIEQIVTENKAKRKQDSGEPLERRLPVVNLKISN